MSSAIPIRTTGDQGIPSQFNRDSFAHSQGMGGISWGGASVGSWSRDEVLMATKESAKDSQHHLQNHVHGSSLAGFDSHGHDGHDLHSHDLHSHAAGDAAPPDANSTTNAAGSSANPQHPSHLAGSPDHHAYFPSIEANFCKDYSCCGNTSPTSHDSSRHYEEQHISPSPPDEPPVMRRVQNIETVSTNDVFSPFDQHRGSHADLGLAGVHGMDLDGLDLGGIAGMTGAATDGQNDQHTAFAPPSFQPLTQDMSAQGVGNKGRQMAANGVSNGMAAPNAGNLRSSNNMNAPVMHGDMTQADSSSPSSGRVGAGPMHNSAAAAAALLGDDDEPTIDDPARQLYMSERTENKPFKCPVIGCEKTYKNQNGSKYHRQHGHQNQTSHSNDDGTYSIIDPSSNTPYPDGMGMEKDKPYRCEICGKRYKNLNGSKYHRAHSTH